MVNSVGINSMGWPSSVLSFDITRDPTSRRTIFYAKGARGEDISGETLSAERLPQWLRDLADTLEGRL